MLRGRSIEGRTAASRLYGKGRARKLEETPHHFLDSSPRHSGGWPAPQQCLSLVFCKVSTMISAISLPIGFKLCRDHFSHTMHPTALLRLVWEMRRVESDCADSTVRVSRRPLCGIGAGRGFPGRDISYQARDRLEGYG